MTTIRVPHFFSFFSRGRHRVVSTGEGHGRAAADAPWVAEMLSAFGDAIMPFRDSPPAPARRRDAMSREADTVRRDLHLT